MLVISIFNLNILNFLDMIVSFCDRLGWVHLKTLLDDFAERLQFGIRRDLTELVRIQGLLFFNFSYINSLRN